MNKREQAKSKITDETNVFIVFSFDGVFLAGKARSR
jgi:hypothetical protein